MIEFGLIVIAVSGFLGIVLDLSQARWKAWIISKTGNTIFIALVVLMLIGAGISLNTFLFSLCGRN